MPRDLFGHVSQPFGGTGARSHYTVPVSLAAHTFAIAAIVVAPLLATTALPSLNGRLVYASYTPVVPPPPPPPAPLRPIADTLPPSDPSAAPVVAPNGITPEPEWQTDEILRPVDTVSLVDGGIRNGLLELPPPPPPPVQPSAPIRVGDGITAPTKIHDVAPAYPAIAQSARVQGVVIIQATIGVDGTVVDAKVLRSMPLLDAAALDAVRQWRYTPTRLNGAPVAVVMTVTVNFQLR